MTNLASLREWTLAIVILFFALPARATVRAFLAKVGTNRNWPLLNALSSSLANLVYILGLRIAADTAPLQGKMDNWIDGGIYVIAVIIVLGMIRRAAMTTVEWSTGRAANSRALQQGFVPLIRNLVTLFVFFTGLIMIMKRFNYDVLSLLTALGVGSLAVGLAAKDTLSNMISGFTLIIDRNLRPGDRINLSGSVGDVEEIGLRSTRLRTPDGNSLIVPNSELVNTRILNLSLPSRETTTSTTIKVPYSIPFLRVKAISFEILDQVAKAHKTRGRWVNLNNLTDGYQSITIGFWLNEMDDAGGALSDFNEKLLTRFQSEQIPLFSPPVQLIADSKFR